MDGFEKLEIDPKSRFLLRGATQFFTRFSTHFPTPGEVQETRRALVTGRREPTITTLKQDVGRTNSVAKEVKM